MLPLPAGADVAMFERDAAALVLAARTGDEELAAWTTSRVGAGRDVRLAAYAKARLAESNDALAQSQAILALAHGFADWEALTAHLDALGLDGSPVADFERAADAIVSGDLATLDALLARTPALVHQRSTRVHRATLLHYVAANGVENYRQRTPPGILAIAERLLDAGADVNAEGEMYGGGAKVLGLTVTSAHPRGAGVQLQLADLLMARGAPLEPRIVHSALMNGCPEAAAHMAAKGGEVGLQDAAGIGRVDLLRAHLAAGNIAADDKEIVHALFMASWYGRHAAIAALLDHGLAVDTRHPTDGESALHIAAHRGDEALVDLLLARGAPIDSADGRYGTPPVVWALHAWLVENRTPGEPYRAVVLRLLEAGATVTREWIDDDRLRGDAELWPLFQRALREG
ncbi:MAG: ankyrin repeat domain-containing protein [Gemmatimonadaceae bacterium]|nr:ankyrin repeat domain-containing protein [Gemmatimonadaceae bacterium]